MTREELHKAYVSIMEDLELINGPNRVFHLSYFTNRIKANLNKMVDDFNVMTDDIDVIIGEIKNVDLLEFSGARAEGEITVRIKETKSLGRLKEMKKISIRS